jgi:hypothetical protein
MDPFLTGPNIDTAFRWAGERLNTALQEVAAELGGDALAKTVQDAAAFGSDTHLPHPRALEVLRASHPDANALVLERMHTVAEAAWQQQLVEERRHRLRRYAGAFLSGVATIGAGMASIGEGFASMRIWPTRKPSAEADDSDWDV